MRKEVFIAIFIGFLLGLIITFGAHTARRSLEKQQSLTQSTQDITPSPAPNDHSLLINAPAPNSINPETPVEVTGITTPGSFIAALGAETSAIAVADNQGNFTVPVDVAAGANKFTITAYNQAGSAVSEDIVIVHSTAPIEENQNNSLEDEEL